MKRLAALAIVASSLFVSACSSTDTSFRMDNGVCYRTRTNYTMGIRTSKATVQAVLSNCGVVAP